MEKYKNAIVVDDDPVSNFICSLLLNRYKIAQKVFVAQTVDSAFNIFTEMSCEDGKLNLILLDIKMPEKDGFDFMEEFNKKYFKDTVKTEVGILTNSNSSEDLQKMLNLGADYWISKPLRKEILLNLADLQVK